MEFITKVTKKLLEFREHYNESVVFFNYDGIWLLVQLLSVLVLPEVECMLYWIKIR